MVPDVQFIALHAVNDKPEHGQGSGQEAGDKALVSSSKISARSEKRPPPYPARLSSSGMLSFCKKILRGITGMEMSG